jgi:hypothetical protein
MNFPILDTLYKWNLTICKILCFDLSLSIVSGSFGIFQMSVLHSFFLQNHTPLKCFSITSLSIQNWIRIWVASSLCLFEDALNIHVEIFVCMCIFNFCECLPAVKLLDLKVILCFEFWHTFTLFSSEYSNLQPYYQFMRVPVSSYSC